MTGVVTPALGRLLFLAIATAFFFGGLPICLAGVARYAESEKLPGDQTSRFPAEVSPWSFSLESLYTFKIIANPWFYTFLNRYTKSPIHYHLATQILSARYQLTRDGGPLFLRGNLELSGGLVGTAIIKGPESCFLGSVLGVRYNLVQPRARLIPYVELRGGPGWSDAHETPHSLQTEITFTYMIGGGLRYDLNPRSSVTVGVIEQHLSNAWLANPDYGFDSLGINAGIFVRY
jgi:hypothetical protein